MTARMPVWTCIWVVCRTFLSLPKQTLGQLLCPFDATHLGVAQLVTAEVIPLAVLGNIPQLAPQALCAVIQPPADQLFRRGLDPLFQSALYLGLIQNHGRKLLPRPPRNQGQSKQYHQLKQPRNTAREAPLAVRFELPGGLLSLFFLCSEVRITPHHENGLLHLHLVWCSILSSETTETLAAARVSGVASFSATLVGGPGGIRTLDLCDANAALSQLSYRPINSFDSYRLYHGRGQKSSKFSYLFSASKIYVSKNARGQHPVGSLPRSLLSPQPVSRQTPAPPQTKKLQNECSAAFGADEGT